MRRLVGINKNLLSTTNYYYDLVFRNYFIYSQKKLYFIIKMERKNFFLNNYF